MSLYRCWRTFILKKEKRKKTRKKNVKRKFQQKRMMMMKMTTSKFVFKLCLSLVCHFVSPGLSFQPEFVRSFLSRPWMLSNQSLNDPITGKIGFLFGYMFLGLGRIRVSKRSSINFDYFLLFIKINPWIKLQYRCILTTGRPTI